MKTEIVPYVIQPGELTVVCGRPHHGKSMPGQLSGLKAAYREMSDEMASHFASRVTNSMATLHNPKKR